MVLIDTSSWTHALRRKGDPNIRDRVERLILAAEAAWCDVVRLELWHGARNDEDREALSQLEAEIHSLEITRDVWDLACDTGSFARGKGLTIPANDLVIFSCARVHDLGLEHNDQHYDRLIALLGHSKVPGRLSGK